MDVPWVKSAVSTPIGFGGSAGILLSAYFESRAAKRTKQQQP